MQFLEEYKDFHKGQRCVILGNGSTAPQDYWNTPRDCLLIGINAGSILLPNLSYIVFLDEDIYPLIEFYPCPKITDIAKENVIHAGIAPAIRYSGMFALWVMAYMGFSEIYLAGFDCYTGKREYWHSEGYRTQRKYNGVQLIGMLKRIKEQLPNECKVIAFNKEIQKVFN